jgi:hypothetical protein
MGAIVIASQVVEGKTSAPFCVCHRIDVSFDQFIQTRFVRGDVGAESSKHSLHQRPLICAQAVS